MANKLTIVDIATSELIPYVNNSRTHSEQQVGQIAASIKEFGFTNPLLVDATNSVIAGHGRLLAAPDCCKISVLGIEHYRIHHRITWNNAVPKIIDESYRKPRSK